MLIFDPEIYIVFLNIWREEYSANQQQKVERRTQGDQVSWLRFTRHESSESLLISNFFFVLITSFYGSGRRNLPPPVLIELRMVGSSRQTAAEYNFAVGLWMMELSGSWIASHSGRAWRSTSPYFFGFSGRREAGRSRLITYLVTCDIDTGRHVVSLHILMRTYSGT